MLRGFIKVLSPFSFFILWVLIPQNVNSQVHVIQPVLVITSTSTAEVKTLNGIVTPIKDSIIRGVVAISGTSTAAWELSFSYEENQAGTWFPISKSDIPVLGGKFTDWDTTTLTDGIYYLQLSTFLAGVNSNYVYKLWIGNNIPSETPTETQTVTRTITTTSTKVLPTTRTPSATISPSVPPVMEVTGIIDPTENNFNSITLTISQATITTPYLETVDSQSLSPTLDILPKPFLNSPTIANPATILIGNIFLSLIIGISSVLLVFVIIGLLIYSRRN